MSTTRRNNQLIGPLRRHLRILAAAGVVGALIGGGLAVVRPPHYSSTSLVLLPDNRLGDQVGSDRGPDVATQVQIVMSTAVLGAAGEQLEPRQSYQQMRRQVKAKSASERLVQVTAKEPTASGAEAVVAKVTEVYKAYVDKNVQVAAATALADLKARETSLKQTMRALDREVNTTTQRQTQVSPRSVQGQTLANLLTQLETQRADVSTQLERVKERIATTISPDGSSATGLVITQAASPAVAMPSWLWRMIWALVGSLLALALSSIAILVSTGRDSRLRLRDDIADAIGSPVLAAVGSRPQSSARGWFALMKAYRPPSVESWSLRQVLRVAAEQQPKRHPRTVVVISLNGDEAGAAIVPQLASFSAMTGTSTRYSMGAGREQLPTLWHAISGLQDSEPRMGLTVGDAADNAAGAVHDVDIVHHILDRQTPALARFDHEPTVLVAVAAGAATDAELARVALAVDAAGGWISGVLLADPDQDDQTSGRRETATPQVVGPTRLTGLTTGAERRSG